MESYRKIKNPETYIELNKSKTSDSSIITVEHRSNNPKRDYLFVNKLQCKHIPASPSQMIEMCKKLSHKVNDNLVGELTEQDKVLVIGFAETATAIGTIVAEHLKCDAYIMHTTRENVDGSKELIRFEEEHSHATTQKLLTYSDIDTDEFMSQFKYILFVEDEISTGNTILNFINAFNKNGLNKNNIRFGVASICNWQNKEWQNKFKKLGIDRFSLISGTLKDVNAKMLNEEVKMQKDKRNKEQFKLIQFHNISSRENTFKNERLGHNKNYATHLEDKIVNLVSSMVDVNTIRIIGSEEFMTMPIKIGHRLEELGKNVICHSTTRSKIDVMTESKFDGDSSGIKIRHSIESAYEEGRKTFLYNTNEHTDLVIIMSDSKNEVQCKKFFTSVSNVVTANKIISVKL